MKKLPWIALILFVKISLAACFSSGYLQDLFLPFVSAFVNGHLDPWAYFSLQTTTASFPYPPLMLYILAPFAALLNGLSIQNILVTHFLIKIPIFIADFVIFVCLCRLRPQSKNLFIWVYLCSPLVFVASYLQGQLDIIPTAFLFVAVVWLLRDYWLRASIAFAAALLCKSTALVALPFLGIYLYRKYRFPQTLAFLATTITIYLFGSLPFLFHSSYLSMVFDNPQQNFIFNSGYAIGNLLLFPIISLMLALVSHFFLYKKINQDLLLSYLNLAFSLLLIFAYPVPSWFVWVTPYLALFLVTARKERKEFLSLYATFCLVYVVFFVFFYQYPLQPDMPNLIWLNHPLLTTINSPHARDIVFTLLAGMLAVQVYLNYRYSIRSNAIYKNRHHATLIGISGDSGAGKSVFLKDINHLLGTEKTTRLEGDGEHRWERGDENWNKHTHLDPKANLLHEQAQVLDSLKQGMPVYRRDYDHHSGKFTDSKLIKANEYVIIAGLHPFYLPKARKLIDIKIYLDTDETLRHLWKVKRDQAKRGHSKEAILKSIEQRLPDREKYIEPQKKYADICFRYFTDEAAKLGEELISPVIKLLVNISANVNLEKLYAQLARCQDLQFHYDYSENLDTQEIILAGNISSQELADIGTHTIPNLDELIGQKPLWESGLRGLRQLLTLLVISHHLKEMQ